MSIVKYGGYIFIFYTVLILYRFSMYPAVLMAISDFEINIYWVDNLVIGCYNPVFDSFLRKKAL